MLAILFYFVHKVNIKFVFESSLKCRMGDDNIDQFKIGLNKPVEEYLELINEQNKQKKAKQSRINKGKELIKGKEEGFNVYLSGANQQRLKNINKKYKKSGKDSSEAVLRKEWTEHPDNAPSFGIAQKSGFPQAIQYNPVLNN